VRIAVASDHAGTRLKQEAIRLLRALGHEAVDMGPDGTEPVDYPDTAERVGLAVARGEVERGILVCGSGIGMSMAANRIPGVRAALCHDALTARLSRAHNDANVLCLGERVVPADVAAEAVRVWCETPFEGGRHAARVQKLQALEGGGAPAGSRRGAAGSAGAAG
jgi:ribose 5-phosphate isomerase B